MFADALLQLWPLILGLMEMKAPPELRSRYSKCLAQAVGKHLAANKLLTVRTQLGLDVPVLLTDGSSFFLASTAEGNSDYVFFSKLLSGAPGAASMMKLLLTRLRAALCSIPPSKALARPQELATIITSCGVDCVGVAPAHAAQLPNDTTCLQLDYLKRQQLMILVACICLHANALFSRCVQPHAHPHHGPLSAWTLAEFGSSKWFTSC